MIESNVFGLLIGRRANREPALCTYIGKVALTLFPEPGTLHPLAGPLLYGLGFIIALIFFGFAIMWLIFAHAANSKAHPSPLNMGFYISSHGFRLQYHSSWCRIAKCCVQGEWDRVRSRCDHIVVRCCRGTVKGAWGGKLFHAPRLANFERKKEKMKRHREMPSAERKLSDISEKWTMSEDV